MVELLSTKLFIPRPRKSLVSRPRLVERLNAGLDRKLTLVAAPAGFGKTTLLSEWNPYSPRCVAWLSLDEGDNDSTRFWTYLISSLRGLHPDLGQGALALLQSPQAPLIQSILTALINAITAFPDPFALVLDDYHVVEAQPIHAALTFLVDHLPKNMHLVLTTRMDPPLPLARLRVHDQLTEIRANDLRFTPDETDSFLTQELGVNLSAEEITALEARTEGWIAGLQIAALSMQGREDIPGFIRTFSGGHRHILGYLADEVLNQRPKGTLKFLLQTSILERLCGPLCDAVTGESGGQVILENLEHANLFITPLDDEGKWYRYHHLFAEVLQARLEQTGRDLLPDLHRRAGQWYVGQGMIEQAVRHMLAGADYQAASQLIEEIAGKLLRKGSAGSLGRWLDALPDELVRARPRLSLARGWTIFMGPALDLERAEEWAQFAVQVAQAGGQVDSDLSGEVAALRAMIAVTRGDTARSRQFAQLALDGLPADSPWRSAVMFSLATANLDFGDINAAADAFAEALKLSQAAGDSFIQLASAGFLADIEIFKGHLNRAEEMYQQVLDWSDPALPQKGTIMAHGGLASILYERDRLDEALAHIQLGIGKLDRVGGEYAAFVLNRALARVQRAKGNWKEAMDLLDRAYQRGQNAKVSMVVNQAAGLQAGLQLAQGDLAAAVAWSENSGLSLDEAEIAHPGWREVEYLALARVLHAQGRHGEALSLLDRLLGPAQSESRNGSIIAILLLQALFAQAQGHKSRALERLEGALRLAEPEGYLRTFLDEGEPMRLLLTDLRAMLRQKTATANGHTSRRLQAYSDKLLAAFSAPAPVENGKHPVKSGLLSERELDILRLIAKGHSNQEIAETLVIAVSTVKSHINNLYGKLGTQRRTQALSIARELGLLEERNV